MKKIMGNVLFAIIVIACLSLIVIATINTNKPVVIPQGATIKVNDLGDACWTDKATGETQFGWSGSIRRCVNDYNDWIGEQEERTKRRNWKPYVAPDTRPLEVIATEEQLKAREESQKQTLDELKRFNQVLDRVNKSLDALESQLKKHLEPTPEVPVPTYTNFIWVTNYFTEATGLLFYASTSNLCISVTNEYNTVSISGDLKVDGNLKLKGEIIRPKKFWQFWR